MYQVQLLPCNEDKQGRTRLQQLKRKERQTTVIKNANFARKIT